MHFRLRELTSLKSASHPVLSRFHNSTDDQSDESVQKSVVSYFETNVAYRDYCKAVYHNSMIPRPFVGGKRKKEGRRLPFVPRRIRGHLKDSNQNAQNVVAGDAIYAPIQPLPSSSALTRAWPSTKIIRKVHFLEEDKKIAPIDEKHYLSSRRLLGCAPSCSVYGCCYNHV